MPTPVLVPNISRYRTIYKIVHWNKKIGDLIKTDDVLLEFEINKATIEFRSPTGGYLIKKKREAGEHIFPGEIIAILEHPLTYKGK